MADNSFSIRRKIPLISDWTIIVVALIAAASYLIPRMSTFIVNLRQLKKMEDAAALNQMGFDFTPDQPEASRTGPYV